LTESGRGDPVVALTIAGSDSAAGAGIQVDLKTFSALGVFGATAITAVTAQNTVGVQAVHPLPGELVGAQISSVLEDLPVAAVKTGMLATAENVLVVADRARRGELPNLVVDPVMVSSSGRPLLAAEAESAYREALIPCARVVTPNLREAGSLVGCELASVEEMVSAARELHRWGASTVVVKGGHLAGDPVDVVYDGTEVRLLGTERVVTRNVHGTGCTLSAAIAAGLASGRSVGEAIEQAKDYVAAALRGAAGWSLGRGQGPLDHFGWAGRPGALRR
jgi:hydroxymethylpyrimidine/phosphomethylpyrimidine kinase